MRYVNGSCWIQSEKGGDREAVIFSLAPLWCTFFSFREIHSVHTGSQTWKSQRERFRGIFFISVPKSHVFLWLSELSSTDFKPTVELKNTRSPPLLMRGTLRTWGLGEREGSCFQVDFSFDCTLFSRFNHAAVCNQQHNESERTKGQMNKMKVKTFCPVWI